MNLDDWIVVAEFEEFRQVEMEVGRLSELALDLGLNPEMVIACAEKQPGFQVMVHPDFFNYFQGS